MCSDFDMQIVYYRLEGICLPFIFIHITPDEAIATLALVSFLGWRCIHPSWKDGTSFWRKGQFFSPLQRYRFCHLSYNILHAGVTQSSSLLPCGTWSSGTDSRKGHWSWSSCSEILTALALRLFVPELWICVLCQHLKGCGRLTC